MIEKYSIDILKPKWPAWKKLIANFFLFNIPVLHIRKVNRLLAKYKHLEGGTFIQAVCKDIGIPYTLYNAESLPKKGAVTLVANHPGGADVVGAIATFWDHREDFKILANELICVKPVKDIVIPVNVMKKNNKVDLNAIDKAYMNEELVIFYAAGLNSRYTEDGLLRDRRWRTSFLDYAYKYKTPIVVMHIDSKNTPLFYKVANFRAKRPSLKKVPLENMFQLREIFKQKDRKIDYTLSNAIPFEVWGPHYTEGDVKKNRELADSLYDFVYSIQKDKKNLTWER